ncbi:MAG: helicase-exonuclease AddAB subunit AddA, partial [Clostridia bacterium]
MQQRGSGKTAVLVERIIRKIIDEKIDIDKILVVTFTNAAAAEMRERILDAIYKKIEENPEDTNLQRQIILLNKASICTIDSFCLDVIKNNFYEIDVSANARVADSTEILLLQQELLDDIFEEKYIANDKDFLKLINTYTKYNKDEELKELILNIYKYIQSNPFPEEWINKQVEMLNVKDNLEYENFSNTPWGQIIVKKIDEQLESYILKLENIATEMNRFPEIEKSTNVIKEDIALYSEIKQNLSDWDKSASLIINLKNPTWKADKKVVNDLVDEAKNIRDKVKDEFKANTKPLMSCLSEEAISDISYMYEILTKLKNLILEFSERFYQKKREKNIMDFSDMEHLALKILVKKDENGNVLKTDIAKKYEEKFEEIAIDEYQDSNLVQEYILNSVSRGNNIFMVGDVKQSIYKFRQARPQLFLDKYNKYSLEPEQGQDRKIQLFKNFRSRKNILDFTNLIFEDIMSKNLGDIDYTQEEYLNLGANFEEISNQKLNTEINIIELKEEENIWKDEPEEESIDNEEENKEGIEEERIEDVVLEARFVAKKIKELIDSKYQITAKSKDGDMIKRDIKYKDIAILLRSVKGIANVYEKEISELGIPVYSESSDGYLQSIEIETIMSLLRIINNPMQDIPLVTVMRSPIGNFTDNDLIEIRMNDRQSSFYEALLQTKNEKVNNFLNLLQELRNDEQYMALDEWIWNIYTKTGYMNYVSLMPNGNVRVSNLKMLFERAKQYESASFKGLFNFINFIDKIKFNSEDLTSAKIIGENEDVVRIMSIHKSKGLEFPVVILAGSGKQFNLRDLTDKVLLDEDLGIGPDYIDEEKHITFKTLAKKALAIKAKDDAISEEMRVLYVALTRPKEKLIIVGRQKDVNKKMAEKQKVLEAYSLEKSEKINPYLLEKYRTYLDWLELVYLKEGTANTKNIFSVDIIQKSDLIKNDATSAEEENIYEKILQIANSKNSEEDKRQKDEINKILQW